MAESGEFAKVEPWPPPQLALLLGSGLRGGPRPSADQAPAGEAASPEHRHCRPRTTGASAGLPASTAGPSVPSVPLLQSDWALKCKADRVPPWRTFSFKLLIRPTPGVAPKALPCPAPVVSLCTPAPPGLTPHHIVPFHVICGCRLPPTPALLHRTRSPSVERTPFSSFFIRWVDSP